MPIELFYGTVNDISPSDLQRAARTMQAQGGGFAAAIADAFFAADSANKARLLRAFAHLFIKFHDVNRQAQDNSTSQEGA